MFGLPVSTPDCCHEYCDSQNDTKINGDAPAWRAIDTTMLQLVVVLVAKDTSFASGTTVPLNAILRYVFVAFNGDVGRAAAAGMCNISTGRTTMQLVGVKRETPVIVWHAKRGHGRILRAHSTSWAWAAKLWLGQQHAAVDALIPEVEAIITERAGYGALWAAQPMRAGGALALALAGRV